VHRRVPAVCSVLIVLSLLLAGAAAKATRPTAKAQVPAEPTAWTSYANDNQLRDSVFSKSLTRKSVPRLSPLWTTKLDGPIYASPLSLRVEGRQLLYVATEAGSVYALSAASGAIVWQRQLGTIDTDGCGTWGITSTGAIDATDGLLFVIGATGSLHALVASTGADSEGYPEQIVSQTRYEYVWGGLRIDAGRVYVPVASYCDKGAADGNEFPEGRLESIPLDRTAAADVWDPVPGPNNLGGIWGWGGVSVDPHDGSIYTAVGNSHVRADGCACYVDDAGYGDQVVHLKADLSSVIDSERPKLPETGDYDFGAAPVLFQPSGCPPLAAANNKIGTLFIWDRRHLASGPLASIPVGDGVSAFVGTPAWSNVRQTIYEAQSVLFDSRGRLGNGVRAFRVVAGCRFQALWAKAIGDGNQATPLVVGDVVFATGGTPGGFYALDASNGARLWSAPTAGPTVAAMITVGGTVFGADAKGAVYAFRPASLSRARRGTPG
jgi:outer membrane protein assembly factor BamB